MNNELITIFDPIINQYRVYELIAICKTKCDIHDLQDKLKNTR